VGLVHRVITLDTKTTITGTKILISWSMGTRLPPTSNSPELLSLVCLQRFFCFSPSTCSK